jgi:SAM-dependent methyltransferase
MLCAVSEAEGLEPEAAFEDWLGSRSFEATNWQGMEQTGTSGFAVSSSVSKMPMVEAYLAKAERILGTRFAGQVADLGSGTGLMAGVLSRREPIRRVHAVEYSRNYVANIMPLVFRQVGARPERIVRVVGDYNELRLEDASLDFVFELEAYHHSESIERTVAEAYRVLKPGGVFVGLERSHPDRTSLAKLQAFLDRQLTDKQKRRYGFDPSRSVTRREWGEHEYRVREWKGFFDMAGFVTVVKRFFPYQLSLRPRHAPLYIYARGIHLLEGALLRRCWLGVPLPGFRGKEKTLILARKR